MSIYIGLFVAVLAVSWSSIFIRWCGDTDPLIISFYRMLWSAMLFGIIVRVGIGKTTAQNRRQFFKLLIWKERWLIFIAGLLLALHFATWIYSLQLTTIAHSLLILSSQPVFALILSPIILKEKGGWRSIVAVAITVIGVTLIVWQDFGFEIEQVWGDLLSLFSALFVTLYIFIARFLRGKIDLLPYLMMVYISAALTLIVVSFFGNYPIVNYPIKIHLLMFLLALIPTGVGHSLLNWSARKIEVYKVNIASLGELVFASFMAFIFFGEKPFGIFYVGAALIVVGIILAISERSKEVV
jgi:drug/metabolite transporter (DMT)-like permease